MHSKSDNIEFMTNHNPSEVIEEIFESYLSRYQIGLESSGKGKDFIFDGVNLLYCKCHEINFKCADSYIGSPDWMKKKKATVNSKSKNNKYFQCIETVALNY